MIERLHIALHPGRLDAPGRPDTLDPSDAPGRPARVLGAESGPGPRETQEGAGA
jgi:hypothetical protein